MEKKKFERILRVCGRWYVAYARDMEHATELKTKIEALVYSQKEIELGACGIVEEELSQRDHRARRVPGVGD